MNLKQQITRVKASKDAKTLIANFVWLSALKMAGFLFPLITLPYLSRVIGVDGFGEIAFAMSVMIFIETFVDFGFHYTATRDIARQKDDINAVSCLFSNVLWAKLFLMFIGFSVLWGLICFMPSFQENRLILLLTFLYIPGHILFPEWFFQAIEQMRYITILNLVSKIIFTILIFCVIKEKEDYVWQPLLTAIGYWVSGVCALWFIFGKFHVRLMRPCWKEIWSTIQQGKNMFLSLIFPNLYTNFSVILLKTSVGEAATGIYDAGMRFITLVDQLFQVLSRVFYPFLARKMDQHSVYVLISGSLSFMASLVLYICAPLFISWFYTDAFSDAVLVIRILAIAPISLFLMNTYGVNYLVLKGKEQWYKNIIIVYSVVGFFVTWIMTPRFGYIGVAITVSGIWLLRGLTTFLFAQKIIRNNGI